MERNFSCITEQKPNFIIKNSNMRKAKLKVLAKLKNEAKKKKAKTLIMNKSSIKGYKNLPVELQKKIISMV